MPASRLPRLKVLLAEPDEERADRLRVLLDRAQLTVLSCPCVSEEEAFEAISRQRPSIALVAAGHDRLPVLPLVERVMSSCPTPLLVLVDPPVDTHLAERWIEAGVLDTIAVPPPGASASDWAAFAEDLGGHLRLLAGVRVVRHIRARAQPPLASLDASHRYLGIVASTGGPPAVSAVLRALGPHPLAAVLVVQHIGQQFVDTLAEWFAREAPMPFGIARDGEIPAPGRAYLAPARANLTLEAGRLRIRSVADSTHLPGDALLASLAREAPVASVGVVLTGLGADGSSGLLALKRAGGLTIAQDRGSSAVWGMPQACVVANAASEVLSLTAVSSRLAELFAPTRRQVF